jgi:NAD(P)-dependent dehydrogenase (short-subunit alcohol dehydrogenase family)
LDINAKGLRVIVTAGAGGIGRVIAETFHNNGARVYICDVAQTSLDECRSLFPDIGASLTDVADASQVDRMFEAATAFLGGLDVLVNNAGIAGPTAMIEDISTRDWEQTLAVNVNGMFYCTRRAVPLLKSAGGGSIINLSSAAGRLGFPLRTPYAASKWGVVGFTQSLAMELGPFNIRVNCIQPGIVEGERIDRVISAKAKALGLQSEQYREQLLTRVSLRRTVSPQDIANTALFLASDAGKNITGQSSGVCGNVETLG